MASPANSSLNSESDIDGNESDKENDSLNFDLVSSFTLDMYMPSTVIETMSELEKESASNRIKNWMHLMKNGVAAPFPTFTELNDFSKKSKKSKSTVEKKTSHHSSNSDARKSDRLALHSIPNYNEKNLAQDSSPPKQRSSSPPKRRSSSPAPSNRTKKVASESSAEEIPPYLETFVNCTTLDTREKALIREALNNTALHKYDIVPILKGKRGMDKIVAHLQNGGCIFNKNLSDVCDELVLHISKKPLNILSVNPDMREGLAVSIVATFPQMAQRGIRTTDTPWSWLFDRANNTGKLATVYRKHQEKAKSRPRGGGTERRKTPSKATSSASQSKPISVDELPLSNNTKLLRLLSPVDSSKGEILRLMKETFPERKAIVSKGDTPINTLLEAYVHLKSFQGELIDLDFELWHPGKKDNLLRNFQDLIPNLMNVAKSDAKKYPPEEVFQFKDEALNALIILSKFLPKSRRNHDFEMKMNPIANIEDIFRVVPTGSNIQYEVNSKRLSCDHPVQPYIIAVGSKQNLSRMYLVWGDSHSLELPKNSLPLRAVDFLLKAHFVLQTPYILGWKYALRFLQVHCFKIPPDQPRETTFIDKALELRTFSK